MVISINITYNWFVIPEFCNIPKGVVWVIFLNSIVCWIFACSDLRSMSLRVIAINIKSALTQKVSHTRLQSVGQIDHWLKMIRAWLDNVPKNFIRNIYIKNKYLWTYNKHDYQICRHIVTLDGF